MHLGQESLAFAGIGDAAGDALHEVVVVGSAGGGLFHQQRGDGTEVAGEQGLRPAQQSVVEGGCWGGGRRRL